MNRLAKLVTGISFITLTGCEGVPDGGGAEAADEAALAAAPSLEEETASEETLADTTGWEVDAIGGRTVVQGVAPSADLGPDAAEAGKDVEVARYRGKLGAELSDEATAEPAAGVLAVRSNTVRIRGEKQQRGNWCVPASSRITLSAVLAAPPTQATLAAQLGTPPRAGTPMNRVSPVLNRHQRRNWYILSTGTTDASHLLTRTRFDIDTKRSALIPAVEGGRLPAWSAHGFTGAHAIVIFGWNVATKQPYRLYLYDPLNVRWSGTYNLTTAQVHAAMRAHANQLVW
jgi:hypothetical protein